MSTSATHHDRSMTLRTRQTTVACAIFAVCVFARFCLGQPDAQAGEPTVAPLKIVVECTPSEPVATDRVRVDATATAPDDRWLAPPTLELDGTPWRLIEALPARLERDDAGRSRITAAFVIEPYLPGEYPKPVASVAWRSPGSADLHTQRSEPGTMSVGSVLPAGDNGTLEAARTLPPAPRVQDRVAWVLIPIGAAVAIVTAAVIVVLRRRAQTEPPKPTPLEQFDAAVASGEIGRALAVARQRLASTRAGNQGSLRAALDEVDLNRFAPDQRPLSSDAVDRVRASLSVNASEVVGEAHA